jgi:hypothetical protein
LVTKLFHVCVCFVISQILLCKHFSFLMPIQIKPSLAILITTPLFRCTFLSNRD